MKTKLAACVALILATQVHADSIPTDTTAAAPAIDAKQLKALKKKYGDGPYPHEIEAYVATRTSELAPQYGALYTEGTRNAVLNNVRVGLAEMELGHFVAAETAFDGAIAQIETIYADDPRAKEARSTWQKESVKDFKGEPYERAMAYYYRGVLYLRAGDYENARASFLAGEFQDSVAEAEEYSADFAALNYLAGWSSSCLGDTGRANELYSKAAQFSPGLAAPSPESNLLMIAELGKAPVKKATGKHDELLSFEAGEPTSDLSATFAIDAGAGEQKFAATSATSISHQALTRGGRPIEAVLNGKAQFKDNMGAVGAAGQEIGRQAMNMGMLSNNSDLAGAGAIIGVIGLFASMAADAAQPDADTRYWETLPDSIHLATATRPAEAWNLKVEFPGSGRTAAAAVLSEPSQKCSVAWTRSESALPLTASAPHTELSASQARKLQKKYGAADRMFREQLAAAKTEPTVETVAQASAQ